MKLTREELETVISFNELPDCMADIETPNGRMIRMLEKARAEYPDEVVYLGRSAEGFERYQVPKKWVKIRAPQKISEERKERMRELGKLHGFQAKS